MANIEQGTCDICDKKEIQVFRTYYYYNIDCLCCNGTEHFEIVYHCKMCEPKAPYKIAIVIKPIRKK